MAVNSPWLCSSSNSTLFGGLVYSRRWYHLLLSLSLSLSLSHHFRPSHFITLISALLILILSLVNSFLPFHFIRRRNYKISYIQVFFFFLVIAIYSSYESSYNSYKFTHFLHHILRNLTVKKSH